MTLLGVPFAAASTPFAGEDFDNGTVFTDLGLNVAGPLSSSFSPDNSSSTLVLDPEIAGDPPQTPPAPGIFQPAEAGGIGSQINDIFGVVNRNQENIAFDVVDSSLEGPLDSEGIPTEPFLNDTAGILRSTDLDNVVAVRDTVNPNNPSPTGSVSAMWTFDISGYTNIQLSIDLAAQGNFEDPADFFRFSYSIDSGPTQTAFNPVADEEATIQIFREGTPFVTSTFFDEGLYDGLLASGAPFFNDTDGDPTTGDSDDDPSNGVDGLEEFIEFDSRDDGVFNGDATAMDGIIRIDLDGTLTDVRSYRATDSTDPANPEIFDTPELVIPDEDDPLSLDGTLISNILTTFTTDVIGAGSLLTLTFDATADGGSELFVFDEILLSGDLVAGGTDGDFNGDGLVNAADYVVFRDGSSPNGLASGDYDEFVENFGSGGTLSVVAAATVPEPSAGALLLLAACGGVVRRRR